MVDYLCPKCRAVLEAPEADIGTTQACPQCNFTVQVPLLANQPAKTSKTALWIGVAVVFVVAIDLISIAIIGKNANSSFGFVGSSVGAAVPQSKP